jgi:DNA-binding GntR family transcriptional regulator
VAEHPAGVTGATIAYRAIREAIVEGTLAPGARVIESRWAAELSLSRTPVREAVRMVAADGLATYEPNRGAVVRHVTRQDVVDLYELRARLEAYGAERAATHATADDLRAMDDAILAFDAAVEDRALSGLERVRRVNEANRRLHNAVTAAGRHPRLQHLLHNTVDAPLVFAAFRAFRADQLERSNLFHKLTREAIARGEPGRAAGLMFEHIMLGRDQVLAELDREDRA